MTVTECAQDSGESGPSGVRGRGRGRVRCYVKLGAPATVQGSGDGAQSALMDRVPVRCCVTLARFHEHDAPPDLDAGSPSVGVGGPPNVRFHVLTFDVARSSPVQPGQEVRRCQRRRALLVAREVTGGELLAEALDHFGARDEQPVEPRR